MVNLGLFRSATADGPAAALYGEAVDQSRRPEFYRNCGVPDTLDGRFEMIVLHGFLALRRLRAGGEPASELAQAFADVIFDDMDSSLREMGAGDLGVGRRVKAMATSFYGRIAAYERGLAGPPEELEEALARNLYGTVTPDSGQVALLAAYVRRESAPPDDDARAAILAGRVSFGLPPGAEKNEEYSV